MGRIYRVAPEGARRRRFERLDRKDTAGLVAAMDEPQRVDAGYCATVASGAAGQLGPSMGCGNWSKRPRARDRLQALWTLRGLGALDAGSLLAVLGDEDPDVVAGVLQCGRELLVESAKVLGRSCRSCAGAMRTGGFGSRRRWRWGIARTTGVAGVTGRRWSRRTRADAWLRAAVLSSAGRHATGILERAVWQRGGSGRCLLRSCRRFLARLGRGIARRGSGGVSGVVASSLGRLKPGSSRPWRRYWSGRGGRRWVWMSSWSGIAEFREGGGAGQGEGGRGGGGRRGRGSGTAGGDRAAGAIAIATGRGARGAGRAVWSRGCRGRFSRRRCSAMARSGDSKVPELLLGDGRRPRPGFGRRSWTRS